MSSKEFSIGSFVGHYACPECSSTDNLTVYKKPLEEGDTFNSSYSFEDDNGDECYCDAFCQTSKCGFKSSKWLADNEIDLEDKASSTKIKKPFVMTDDIWESLMEIKELPHTGWKTRGIPAEVDEFYGVTTKVVTNDNGKRTVGLRHYPSTKDDKLTGYHVRNNKIKQARKKAKAEGLPKPKGVPFFPIGYCKVDSQLFGQSLFSRGGRHLIITAGEEDCLACYDSVAAQKYGTAVVSPTIGEGNAHLQVKNNLEWVMSFEKVTIVFDNDDAGIEGAELIAKMLKPSQAFIAKLPKGDCCDYAKRGLKEELKTLILFKAEQYTPVGVYSLSSMWESFEKSSDTDIIPFPQAFGKLNKMMAGGRERGEITTIGAYTSIGKSTIISHSVYHVLKNTKYKVGAFYLEGTQREVVRDLLSIDIKHNLRLDNPEDMDMEHLRKEFMEGIAKNDNFTFVDSQGALTLDDMFDKLSYLAKGCGCDLLIIDPIQAAIASDSNSATIEFMDRLLKLAKQTNCAIDIVSHMRKPNGDDPHGCTEYDLLGSSSINQISFNTILASRDKMSDDPEKKNWTQLKLVKCRRVGNTGSAGGFKYDHKTTLIEAAPSPYGGDSEQIDMFDEELFEEAEINNESDLEDLLNM